MNRRIINFPSLVLVLSLLVFAGCSAKKAPQPVAPPVDPAAIGQPESLESPATTIMEGRTTGPMLPVYFDFDNFSIRPDQRPRIELNAEYLKDNQDIYIRIEGNCDPKGTREYNLALGEKRAISAKKYLINLGIDGKRIGTVSFGEEKILLHGPDEMTRAQNRRADFVVK